MTFDAYKQYFSDLNMYFKWEFLQIFASYWARFITDPRPSDNIFCRFQISWTQIKLSVTQTNDLIVVLQVIVHLLI